MKALKLKRMSAFLIIFAVYLFAAKPLFLYCYESAYVAYNAASFEEQMPMFFHGFQIILLLLCGAVLGIRVSEWIFNPEL